jgi:soluble lytic murein transglycosylase-like protein
MRWIVFTILLPSSVAAYEQRYSRAEVVAMADYHAGACGVPRELIYAVIDVESGWRPQAVSAKGAAGLMQLMPYTAFRFGGANRFDPVDNLRSGIRYLAFLLRLFHGDLRLVVAAYYAGEGRIARRGLDYESVDVNQYVRRVASRYYHHRLISLSTPQEDTR